MGADRPIQTLCLFLASPWDTAEARQAVARVEAELNNDPAYRERMRIELRRWDDPDRPVPVSFRRNPQADVIEYTGDPADCDLLVALFRHVFGSPLPQEDGGFHYGLSPDGDAWTGTEWEIARADAADSRVRDIWVYRDKTPWQADGDWDDDEADRHWQQYQRVKRFFKECKTGAGSILKGVNDYEGSAGLEEAFGKRLREWVTRQLLSAAAVPESAPAPPAATEALNDDQRQLLAILRDSDEPLDAGLAAAVHKASIHGLRGYLLHRFAAWCVAGRQLDRQFVNLDLMIDHGPQSPGERFQPQRFETLQQLLGAEDARGWVLIGDPGAGKSVLLQHHELLMARAGLRALARGEALPELCVWQRLSDCPHDVADPAAWLAAQWRRLYPELPSLDELGRQHRLRWLLDGLNEIQAPDAAAQRRMVRRWADWAAALPADRTAAPIFSVRTLDYSATLSSPGLTVRQARLAAWSPAQIEHCCTLRLGPGNRLWPAIEADARLLELCALPFNLDAQCGLTHALGRPAADRAELFAGMAWQRLRHAEQRKELEHPSLLTEREHKQLADERYWREHLHQLPARGSLVPGLDRQAATMHRASDGTEISLDEDEVAHWLPAADRAAWLVAAQALHIAEVELSGRFRYTHQLWQEFHAARGLRDLPLTDPAALPDLRPPTLVALEQVLGGRAAKDPLPGPGVSAWEEPVKLAVQMATLQTDAARAAAITECWLAHLQQHNLALAGRAAVRIRPWLETHARLAPLLAGLRQALLARSRDPEVDVRLRIEAGLVLGELGDPRYEERRGPTGQRYLWPKQWVKVPGGVYRIGDDSAPYDFEKPETEVTLAPFEMAFAPVTNAEFRCFIEAGGYEDERWWQGETAQRWRHEGIRNEESINDWTTWLAALREDFDAGVQRYFPSATAANIETNLKVYAAWSAEEASQILERQFGGQIYREPSYWGDRHFNAASQPVVGLTVFEAQAYACWLAAQSGRPVRLPVEAEWEAAARGVDRNRWPWGGADPEPRHLNADPAHLRRTSPVGVFPDGDSLAGLTDLAGNVWEWTSSLYTNRLDEAGFNTEAPDGPARRVVRGGSWGFTIVLCRASCRLAYTPVTRYDVLGFRLVASGPIQGTEP